MLTRDLKTYAELGRALWADTSRSGTIAIDTLSAISLLEMTEEKAIDKASSVLLDRAIQQGMAEATRDALGVGAFGQFFRLFPEERFILAALHLGRWSYDRLARVMNQEPEQVEFLAWRARVQLAAGLRVSPLGAKLASPSCPEYQVDRPWTQRFLDEEIRSGRETLFLQNHLMGCPSCMQALNRCRDIYFAVDKMLPRVAEGDGIVGTLQRICKRGRELRYRDELSFGRSVYAFMIQRGFAVLFGAASVLFIYWLVKRS